LLRTAREDTGVRKMRHLIVAVVTLIGVLMVASTAAQSF